MLSKKSFKLITVQLATIFFFFSTLLILDTLTVSKNNIFFIKYQNNHFLQNDPGTILQYRSTHNLFSPLTWWKNILSSRYTLTNEEEINKAKKILLPYLNKMEPYLPKKYIDNFNEFSLEYINETLHYNKFNSEYPVSKIIQMIDLVKANMNFIFNPFNVAIREPIDYYQLANDFWRPLIDLNNSKIPSSESLSEISKYLEQGSNVILLSNHQTEPDPQIIHLVLEHLNYTNLARKIIMVAGHRVRSDPLAIPFSMGCNILSVHSKKHLENVPDKRSEKLRENLISLKILQNLLKEGGQLIWMAPSGGRDRIHYPSSDEDVSKFDQRTIELYVKLTSKLPSVTYYIPTALYTSPVCPPPQTVNKLLGERRTCSFSSIGLALGQPYLSSNFDTIEKMTQFFEDQTKLLYKTILN